MLQTVHLHDQMKYLLGACEQSDSTEKTNGHHFQLPPRQCHSSERPQFQ
uniref:Uncharacterized protein n=1 Tax=Anguilla anguilla TaxID=7936 RepID=A0A0E9WIK6_ANGAN